ncbi:MAG: Fe(3+) ABC transporter substrate-binding protein [Alphaproteobacteria bacterium]
MKITLKNFLTAGALSALLLMPLHGAAQADDAIREVNVYSYRQPNLVKPLFDAFTAETGIAVNMVFAKKGMVERLKAEGAASPADLIFTVDIGRLIGAVEADVTQPVASETLAANIPAAYRDPANNWFGLTTRARVLFAAKDRVGADDLLSYDELAEPEWKGRICTRSGAHPYTIALIASLITHWGEEKTEDWLRGVKKNLARKPQGNDRGQVKAIKEGLCDVSFGNTYYMGKMLANEEQRPWADAVRVVFPNQADRGTHVNISGMALAKHAPNRDNAVKLMEYLSSDAAQALYAEQNFEYPVKPGVAWSPVVEEWGRFKADKAPLAEIAKNRPAALLLVNKVGFDH